MRVLGDGLRSWNLRISEATHQHFNTIESLFHHFHIHRAFGVSSEFGEERSWL
jgi:hypothetical protein